MRFFLLVNLLLISMVSFGCNRSDRHQVYNGEVEVTRVRLSAQLPATLTQVFVDEGDTVVSGQVLAFLDTENIRLQRQQQQDKLGELKLNDDVINTQIEQVSAQLNLNKNLLAKTEILVSQGALISQKQDELMAQVKGLRAQLDGLTVNKQLTQNKQRQLASSLQLFDIQLGYGVIKSPLSAVVINTFHQKGELVNAGTPLLEIADLSQVEVRIYVPLQELAAFALGQAVTVRVDGIHQRLPGRVSWIASEAEFTPKTILTQETRTTLVYAIKVRVPNDKGLLKIGMPVEVDRAIQ